MRISSPAGPVRLLVLTLLLTVLAGCGAAGAAAPAAGPAEVDWAAIDPCGLLPPADRSALGLGGDPRAITGPPAGCHFTPSRDEVASGDAGISGPMMGVQMTVVTGDGGFDDLATRARAEGEPVEDAVVAGLPAVRSGEPGPVCVLVLDAPGAGLLIFGDGGCDTVTRAAETALANLPGA
ncbi:DUF3558 family protein [Pseudonocardia nematodicida]|uniref:DUF3558 family protein n=1 Tax=Pseudonocardia nematodicida TaxID=1206997 RepID=A0ABV1KIG1_9PSEU